MAEQNTVEQKKIHELLEETTITETMNIPTEDTSLEKPLTRRISLSSLKTFLLDGISSAWSGITGKPFNSIDTNTLNVDESNVLSVKADMYASKDNFDNHINDSEIHITELERTSWNEKLGIDDIVEGVGISLDKDIDSNKITISSLATINPNKILGEYDTVLELETAYPDGSNLDGGFLIGTENPKEYYYWSTTETPNSWQSAGTLQGEKGTDGSSGLDGKSAYETAVDNGFVGTEIEWLASLKGTDGENGIDGLTVSVNNVEQVDGDITLTASEIPVENENFVATDIDGALEELFTSVSNGKTLIASAITDKGVTTLATDTFAVMADNIGQIEGGGGIPEYMIYSVVEDGVTSIPSMSSSTSYSNWFMSKVYIPLSVTQISNYFVARSPITEVIGAEGVLSFGNYVFSGCTSLLNITLLSTTMLGTYALRDCTSLTNINLDSRLNVLTIGTPFYLQSDNLTVASFLQVGNALVDNTGSTAKTIYVKSATWNNLTEEQKAIFTNKNYTISVS